MTEVVDMLKQEHESVEDEEQKCTECLQWGRCNHRGVCEFCEDPYGQSALMELVELEEDILRGQE
jgi:recombinational DNA repair protein RecR